MRKNGWLGMVAIAVTGCALLHRGQRPPTIEQLSHEYGCPATAVQDNWRQHRLVPALPGTPICNTLGRYGEPVSVHTERVAGMQLLSLLHHSGDRYADVTFVYYEDTDANRKVGRPIGRWIVQRCQVTR